MEERTLEQLATELYDAKKQEAEAKAARIACEEAIAELVETGDNASKTVEAGPNLKVTVKRALNYKPNVEGIRSLDIDSDLLPLSMTPPVPAGYEFDKKKYEALRDSDPVTFAKVAAMVDVVPAKVSVTLKLA